jgi:hypothetical protein
MALTHNLGKDEPEIAPVPATRGEPATIIILAVVGGIVALVIALWLWLG